MITKVVEHLARLEIPNSADMAQKARSFVNIHLNPAFGWHIAGAFARAKVPFPMVLIGRDHWLFRTYMMRLNPAVYRDRDVETAFQISQEPVRSGTLKALLIAGLGKPIDEHLRLVAKGTGYAQSVVEAFEILFFNVLDRPRDGAYLSEIVYPDGRMVEFDEDYFKNTPVEDLLLRAAYNSRDLDLVLRLAGMTEADCRKEHAALRDREQKLESVIMGNALLFAQAGLINQPGIGLQRALKLLAASCSQASSPNEAEGQAPYDIAAELASFLASLPPITDEERKQMLASARPGQSYWSDENGNISAFDASEAVFGSSQNSDCRDARMTWFPEPVRALWKNKDHDVPVILVARMSQPGLPDHYLTDTNTGIPASEVVLES